MNAPERASKNHCTPIGSPRKTHKDDFSHLPIRVGVSSTQLAIVRAAVAFEFESGRWPSARELAAYADIAAPVLWAELKKLGALGCVAWTKIVKVARMPDGVVQVMP